MMKHLLQGIAWVVLFSNLSGNAADQPLVILLGDSIRMNYQTAATEALQPEFRVWAPKENGRHTEHTLTRLNVWLEGKRPVIVHFNAGLHELYLDAKTGLPRHTEKQYEANLREALKRLKALPGVQVIFALTTPVIEERQAVSKGYGRVVRRNADVDRYNAIARRVCGELDVAVNDLHAFIRQGGVERCLREDGIHLSPEGIQRAGAHVAAVIRKAAKSATNPPR